MPQPNRIHILPPQVAGCIAAGQAVSPVPLVLRPKGEGGPNHRVVERPASVVKELIENSLDADAQAISVEIQDGGLSMIRVSDDGHGIARADAPLTLKRFATSKIRTTKDLEAIRTLGFRGEALSSIAAVARLEILTRTEDEPFDLGPQAQGDQGLEGTHLTTKDDQAQVSPAASPVGTSVTVRELFYNTPDRRKFLKSPTREAELVRKTVVRYALAWPQVAFRLVVDGRESLAALRATPLERLGAVLGQKVAADMIEIDWEAGDLGVRGHISGPALGRSSRQGQYFILNGRPIRSGLLAVMLERPYAGRLPPGRHPLAVVRIEIDPHQVDVNVHPRKAEVRFAQERDVYQALLWAVEAALSSFPRQEGYPNLDWPFGHVPVAPAIVSRAHVLDPLHLVLYPWSSGPRTEGGLSTGSLGQRTKGGQYRELEPEYVVAGGLRVLGQLRTCPEPFAHALSPVLSPVRPKYRVLGPKPLVLEHCTGLSSTVPQDQGDPGRSSTVPKDEGQRVQGNTYIVAQGSQGLVIVDQHAAHEQVLFETLLHGSQPVNLEPPARLEFTPHETERLTGHLNLLADLGLEIEPCGKRSFLLRALPPELIHTRPLNLVAALLNEMERDWHLDEERLRERLVARAACTAAVKAGDHLSMETMQDLVDDLLTVWSPATCPHGRPAFITLSVEELERRFLRW